MARYLMYIITLKTENNGHRKKRRNPVGYRRTGSII